MATAVFAETSHNFQYSRTPATTTRGQDSFLKNRVIEECRHIVIRAEEYHKFIEQLAVLPDS
jgi:hypothetical protein